MTKVRGRADTTTSTVMMLLIRTMIRIRAGGGERARVRAKTRVGVSPKSVQRGPPPPFPWGKVAPFSAKMINRGKTSPAPRHAQRAAGGELGGVMGGIYRSGNRVTQ